MKNFIEAELQILVKDDEKKVELVWLGKSRGNQSASLSKFFNSIIEELYGKDVILDFTKLDLMSSSTVVSIVLFIKNLDSRKLKTKINYNKSSEWQNASFIALETIVMTMKNIRVEGA